jgi:acyl carrier protein
MCVACPVTDFLANFSNHSQDRTLSNMTAEDFSIPLQAKHRGTLHLHETFQNSCLDFFLLLSSAASVVGTKGSANYAAGNCFLDQFAHNQRRSTTRYISANIGGVEDALVNNRTRERNFREHGLILITADELLSFLEYSMSLETLHDGCTQAVIGFDSESIAQVRSSNSTPASAMFTHIWGSPEERAVGKGPGSARSIKDMIRDAKEPNTIRSMIAQSLTAKICNLVAIDENHMDQKLSVGELGLDSLSTIEFQNWISNEFHATVPALEILSQENILTLASTIFDRSEYVEKSLGGPRDTQIPRDQNNSGLTQSSSSEHESSASHKSLPGLPLPDLDNTLQMYLDSRRCFLSSEELSRTTSAIGDFLQEGGLGRNLQGRLMDRLRDPNTDGWQWDLYAKDIYLARRDPIHPFTTFYSGHPVSDSIYHSQTERAAIVSAAAYTFKNKLNTATLEPNQLNGEPLCMDTLNWLFNSSREPGVGFDVMRNTPRNDYLVALRHGHMFRIDLCEGDGGAVPWWKLKEIFQSLLDHSAKVLPSVAALTADERNSWAEVGSRLDRRQAETC